MPTVKQKLTHQYCDSEYSKLLKVLVCKPEYMEISTIINETQKHYLDENIDRKLAAKQHENFIQALQKHGAEVMNIQPAEEFPEQVFTRDIGFTVGDTTYVSKMESKIRQGEEHLLKEWLRERGFRSHPIGAGSIEGGDILIDRNFIYAGHSGRTTKAAIERLRSLLPQYDIAVIPFNKKYLHLDCVFNILSPDEALVFPPALKKKELEFLASRYRLIEVNEQEQFTMGTNVLSIGNKKLFSLPQNKEVNAKLRSRGYEVIEVDISEIIKSGGAFRCCTMPIERERGPSQ